MSDKNNSHHFWFSVVVMIGGGLLAHTDPSLAVPILSALSAVVGHFLGVKTANGSNGNGAPKAN